MHQRNCQRPSQWRVVAGDFRGAGVERNQPPYQLRCIDIT